MTRQLLVVVILLVCCGLRPCFGRPGLAIKVASKPTIIKDEPLKEGETSEAPGHLLNSGCTWTDYTDQFIDTWAPGNRYAESFFVGNRSRSLEGCKAMCAESTSCVSIAYDKFGGGDFDYVPTCTVFPVLVSKLQPGFMFITYSVKTCKSDVAMSSQPIYNSIDTSTTTKESTKDTNNEPSGISIRPLGGTTPKVLQCQSHVKDLWRVRVASMQFGHNKIGQYNLGPSGISFSVLEREGDVFTSKDLDYETRTVSFKMLSLNDPDDNVKQGKCSIRKSNTPIAVNSTADLYTTLVLHEVKCSARALRPGHMFATLTLEEEDWPTRKTVAVIGSGFSCYSPPRSASMSPSNFIQCSFNKTHPEKSIIRKLITDITPGLKKTYTCKLYSLKCGDQCNPDALEEDYARESTKFPYSLQKWEATAFGAARGYGPSPCNKLCLSKESCSCECNVKAQRCGWGSELDVRTCKCVPNGRECNIRCREDQLVDPEPCKCVCPVACMHGSSLNESTCQCEDDCQWTDLANMYPAIHASGFFPGSPTMEACRRFCDQEEACMAVGVWRARGVCEWFSTVPPASKLLSFIGMSPSAASLSIYSFKNCTQI